MKRRARLVVGVMALWVGCPSLLQAGETWHLSTVHPRLLIGKDDLPEMRVRAGVEGYEIDPVIARREIPFGKQANTYKRLVKVGDDILKNGVAEQGDLYFIGILHLISGELSRPDKYTDFITAQLLRPGLLWIDLDTVLALDFAWDALSADVKERVAERFLPHLNLLEASDSPMDHPMFEQKLASLALAMVLLDETFKAEMPAWALRLRETISAAEAYLHNSLIRFCQQRGSMAVSGGNALAEAENAILAVELWRSATGDNLWPELSSSLGQSFESSYYADSRTPRQKQSFVHDDGSDNPVNPCYSERAFHRILPWIVAARTNDPAASWVAQVGMPPIGQSQLFRSDREQWVRLLYGEPDRYVANRNRSPLARHFGGGWIAMRDSWRSEATVLLFDAGQPYWHARQHFDAGQFQIYREGKLAGDSGDDVTSDATTAKGGSCQIGRQPGDWDHYYQATIAHNCVTVADRNHPIIYYGKPWIALGNQRPIEGSYHFDEDNIEDTERRTGQLLAFETNKHYSFARSDLTAAYAPKLVKRYVRSILFLHDGAILIHDQLAPANRKATTTWHLQLPTSPTLSTEPISTAKQVHGIDERAGIWELSPEQPWLEVANEKSRLYVKTLLPVNAKRRVSGGPMNVQHIEAGPLAGTEYFGGDPMGYEHRLWPLAFLRGPNAAYTLGSPTSLGAQFGQGTTWGRYDVYLKEAEETVHFLHLLIPADLHQPAPRGITSQVADDGASVFVDIPFRTIRAGVRLSLTGEGAPGKVELRRHGQRTPQYEQEITSIIADTTALPIKPVQR